MQAWFTRPAVQTLFVRGATTPTTARIYITKVTSVRRTTLHLSEATKGTNTNIQRHLTGPTTPSTTRWSLIFLQSHTHLWIRQRLLVPSQPAA